MDWKTTATLLEGLRDFDNKSAWRRFVRGFRGPIVAFGSSMGLRKSDAEDLAQETLAAFAKAYKEGKYDRSKGRLSGWLFGIAFRQLRYAKRKAARGEMQIVGSGDGTTFWSGLPDEKPAQKNWDQEWERTALKSVLDQVAQEVGVIPFRAFDMVVRMNRTPSDVAAELGIPVKTVYNAKYRILRRVRQLRQKQEGEF